MSKGVKIMMISLLSIAVILILLYFLFGNSGKTFKVVFDSNGGTSVPEQIVKKGEKVEKPNNPTKENGEFAEWQLNGTTYNFDSAVESDLTLVATWKSAVKYTVKVTIDGQDYTAEISEGDKLTLEALNIPAKEGYKIVLKNNNADYDMNTTISGNMELTASYVELKTYTVKFNSNGGSKVADAKVKEGSLVTEPTVTKSGYVLDGWYDGETKFDFSTPITKDMTLKANWSSGTKINVIFTVDGKTYKTVSVNENTKVSKPTNPTKKGYKFVEWQLNGAAFDFNTKITAETTLVAVFEESKTVTVTFDSDGGSSVATQTVETGSKATKPTDPTKSGYKFVEWQLNGKQYSFNTAVNDNITLKAKWVKTYTVTFNTDGGSSISAQTVETGGKATKPANPTKSGYTFSKWLLDNKEYDFNSAVTKDITLIASYTKNSSPTATPTVKPSTDPTVAPTVKPSADPTPTPVPTPTPTPVPTPTPKPSVTYSLEWESVTGSVVEQYRVYIKSSAGGHVAGKARLYLVNGGYEDVNISTSGVVKPAAVYDRNSSYVISAN